MQFLSRFWRARPLCNFSRACKPPATSVQFQRDVIAIYMKRGSFEQQCWQQSLGTRLVNTDITLRWRRCNTMCCNYLFCIVFTFVCSKLLYFNNFFFLFSSVHAWYGLPSKLANNCQRGKMTHCYPTDMPFLPHFFCKIATKLHKVSNTEVAGGLHARFEVAEWEQQRLHWKSRQKLHQKLLV